MCVCVTRCVLGGFFACVIVLCACFLTAYGLVATFPTCLYLRTPEVRMDSTWKSISSHIHFAWFDSSG